MPDPIDRVSWDRAVKDWEERKGQESLLAYLLHNAVVEEKALIEALQTATGARFIPIAETSPSNGQKPPLARLLEQHGFVYHGMGGQRHRVTGGPGLPPGLDQLIGTDAGDWEWFLAHPLRTGIRNGPGLANRHTGAGVTGDSPQWLEELLQALVSRGATDIHFERVENTLTVRFHAGREMETAGRWRGEVARTVLQLLRTRAGLAAAAAERPLDGHITIAGAPCPVSARLSLIRTINGESAVLRIPRRGVAVRPLPELGMPTPLIEECMDCILNRPGLILCCGPTGSGKTTTLYGLLHDLSGKALKVLTIEDPVEQQLANVIHCQVNTQRNWDFPTAIRAFLRQDPDVIMVGEIRDAVSAAAACRAALSGHCVLSTLHARSEVAALHRLLAWGVGPGTIADSIRLVINQRLTLEEGSGRLKPVFRWKTPRPEATYRFLTRQSSGSPVRCC